MAEKIDGKTAQGVPVEEPPVEEAEPPAHPGWREIFRQAFEKARREQRVTNRRDLGRDRSRSLLLLGGAAIVVLLLFLAMFSSSSATRKTAEARRRATPDLGHRVAPGRQQTSEEGSATPLLNAQTGQQERQENQSLTAEDVGRTASPTQSYGGLGPKPWAGSVTGGAGPYALSKIDFSDPASQQQASAVSASPASSLSDDLKKPSLVFVRSIQGNSAAERARVAPALLDERPAALGLLPGTKLLARLQSVASSALQAPIVAAIEYNYERNGQVIVPAGARALGSLRQVDRSGLMAFHFDTLQLPDGTVEKIDGTAMSLTFGPLRGNVRGKRIGTRFLVGTLTGLGTAATYLVGAGRGNGLSDPLSEGALLRDRMATNIAVAGDQQLTNLAFGQNIVVTLPGNTRFYIVVQKGPAAHDGDFRSASTQPASDTRWPTLKELRELMQLRHELSELYQQQNTQDSAQQAPQQ